MNALELGLVTRAPDPGERVPQWWREPYAIMRSGPSKCDCMEWDRRVIPAFVFSKRVARGIPMPVYDPVVQTLEEHMVAVVDHGTAEAQAFDRKALVDGVHPATTRSLDARAKQDRRERAHYGLMR